VQVAQERRDPIVLTTVVFIYLLILFFLILVVTMHIKRKLINAPTSSARLSVSYLPVSHSQVNNSIQKESQLNVKHRLLCQHSGGIKQN